MESESQVSCTFSLGDMKWQIASKMEEYSFGAMPSNISKIYDFRPSQGVIHFSVSQTSTSAFLQSELLTWPGSWWTSSTRPSWSSGDSSSSRVSLTPSSLSSVFGDLPTLVHGKCCCYSIYTRESKSYKIVPSTLCNFSFSVAKVTLQSLMSVCLSICHHNQH